MTEQLIAIERQSALQVFTTPGAIDPYLGQIKARLAEFQPDISTVKGRKEVASWAYRVAQTKTYLEGVGKELADEQKEIPRKIDACRKHVRETLDRWKDDIRRPLTEWEAAEEARVARHVAAIERLEEPLPFGAGIDVIRSRLAEAEAIQVGPECDEYLAAYERAKEKAVGTLRSALAERERHEAEQAELARLRKEAEQREAQARREEQERQAAVTAERIRLEAAENAKAAAERAARAEIEQAEARSRAEREAAEVSARAAAEAASQREADLKRQAEDAERRVRETEERIRREQAEKEAAERSAADARAADREHRGSINRKAVEALTAGGLDADHARQAVILIAAGMIPNVTIRY